MADIYEVFIYVVNSGYVSFVRAYNIGFNLRHSPSLLPFLKVFNFHIGYLFNYAFMKTKALKEAIHI